MCNANPIDKAKSEPNKGAGLHSNQFPYNKSSLILHCKETDCLVVPLRVMNGWKCGKPKKKHKGCPLTYIKQTKRSTKIRLQEEKAACRKASRTKSVSKNLTNDQGYAEHHLETSHQIQFEQVHIFENEANGKKRKLLEGLYIERNWGNLMNKKKGLLVDHSWLPLITKIPELSVKNRLPRGTC